MIGWEVRIMDNLYLSAEALEVETFTVKIIDQYTGTHSEYEDEVDFVTLELMLKADYVTLRGKTISKRSTRVDEKGNVFFYGSFIDESAI